MSSSGRNVSLAEVLRANNAALRAGLHTSMPGVIQSYDPVTKTADVLPVIKTPLYEPETGEEGEAEDLPVIPNVPVSFPRGGGWHLSFPLEAGDHVTLVFSEAATGQWRTSGEPSSPGDVRRHSLGYPTALLGAAPDDDVLLDDAVGNPITEGKLVLGKDGDPTQSIRISPSGIEIGGLLPLPLAMAVPTAAGFTAEAVAWTALAAGFTLKATATPAEAAAIWTPMAAAATAAAAACTAQALLIPATISKGQ